MKTSPFNSLFCATLGVAGLAASLQAATTFTFDGFTTNDNVGNVYGDNASASGTGYSVTMGAQVIGTPAIDITWQVAPVTSGTQYYNSWDSRGSVAQLDYTQPNTGSGISWQFAPTPTVSVVLSSFQLDRWTGGAENINWSITGATSGTLASGNWTPSSGGRETISPNVTGALGEMLTMKFVRSGGTGSYVAVDNLVLDQVIPEPSSAALGGLALGALALRRRRA